MTYSSDPLFIVVFGVVVITRCLLPFTIFRYPLAGILGCLVVDGIDQSIFQHFGYDPPFYQNYDKAMDVFYLGIAFISTMRNWTSKAAIGVSRFLFFYRQFGVVAFELTGWRPLLLIFCNTFEYFFIAYEAIRTRWNTVQFQLKFWVTTAALIWIFIKLPQEYWIHIAQLDFTDTVQDVPWFLPLVVTALAVAALVFWFVVRPRLAPADHAWQFVAPPSPPELDTPQKRAAFVATHTRVWSAATAEKVALIGMLSIIFASLLPGADVAPLRMMQWVGYFAVLNAAVTIALAKRGRNIDADWRGFLLRYAGNLVLLLVVENYVYEAFLLREALFFVLLFTVMVTTYNRFRPNYELRFLKQKADPGQAA